MTKVLVFLSKVTRDSCDYDPTGDFFNNDDVAKHLTDGNYQFVASIETDKTDVSAALNDAYALTQNFDGPWCPDHPTRSTMVGDVFAIDGVFHVVAPVGFAELPLRREVAEAIAAGNRPSGWTFRRCALT